MVVSLMDTLNRISLAVIPRRGVSLLFAEARTLVLVVMVVLRHLNGGVPGWSPGKLKMCSSAMKTRSMSLHVSRVVCM